MSDPDHTTPIEFRTIARFVGYRFGDDGSVWSQRERISLGGRSGSGTRLAGAWKPMTPRLAKGGYLVIGLTCTEGGRREYKVHRLILEAFQGPCPAGMGCRHLDGNPLNNRAENLRWGTQRENNHDKLIHGTQSRGSNHGIAKLVEEQVAQIKIMLGRGCSERAIGRQFGVKRQTINAIRCGRTWSHVPGG